MRIATVLVLLVVILAAPFLLRPKDERKLQSFRNAERLVIITPHNESIQNEFGRAFVRHMRQTYGRDVFIDWRTPGGTSEIARFLKSEYDVRFKNLWHGATKGAGFTDQIRAAYTSARLQGPALNPVQSQTQQGTVTDLTGLSEDDLARFARQLYLDSDIGVGIDLFFGGGAYDFSKQADAGNLVARDASGRFGPAALAEQRPDWFSDAIMPESVSGEPFRDSEFRWVGTVLSSFGICYNVDVLERLGMPAPLRQWNELADPRLLGQVALADPSKSGSTTKAFEMLIQQQMREALEERQQNSGRSATEIEAEAIRDGWDRAMKMIFQISGNGRYFTDSATKVPHDISLGDAAAGMGIDFYGRTYNEIFRDHRSGFSRVQFVMPVGGTSIGADPIAMLRGASNPELAHLFIEFVLSPAGQKLWNFRPGTPGGPRRVSLRRPPIRRDFYEQENKEYRADPEVNPYHIARGFTYEDAWTGRLFAPLRFLIRCGCVDTHEEQRKAWRAIVESGMPTAALEEYLDLSMVSYDRVQSEIAPVLKSKDKIREVELARDLSGHFREKYARCLELCEESLAAKK